MLLLLAKLGLRTCEVVRLKLEDIDWELGPITIRSKGGTWSKLPLPPDVENALAASLQHDRPRCFNTAICHSTRSDHGLVDGVRIVKTVTRALKEAEAGSEPVGPRVPSALILR